jgi:hypothetical protein
VKFTAKQIIEHIIAHCTCANDRAVQVIRTNLDKKIRYKGQSLLDWYQQFTPIVNKYQQAAAKATQTATENRKEEPIATDLLIFQCLLHVSGGLNKIVSDLTLASVLLTNAGKDDNITKDEVTKAKAAADKATDDAVKVKAQTDAAAASPAALAEGEPVTNANLNTAADALEAAGKALDAAALLLEATPAAGAPGGTTAGDVASLSEHHKELLTEIIKKLTPEEVMELFVLILKMINKNP